MSHRIRDAFDTYLRTVVPADASLRQIRDFEYTFFAGAFTVVCILEQLGHGSAREIAALLAETKAEGTDFMKCVRKGKD